MPELSTTPGSGCFGGGGLKTARFNNLGERRKKKSYYIYFFCGGLGFFFVLGGVQKLRLLQNLREKNYAFFF